MLLLLKIVVGLLNGNAVEFGFMPDVGRPAFLWPVSLFFVVSYGNVGRHIKVSLGMKSCGPWIKERHCQELFILFLAPFYCCRLYRQEATYGASISILTCIFRNIFCNMDCTSKKRNQWSKNQHTMRLVLAGMGNIPSYLVGIFLGLFLLELKGNIE